MRVKKIEKTSSTVTGIIRVHPRGFGFVIPEDKKLHPQDIFIPKHLTNGAVDGDLVEAHINELSVSEKGPEGEVIAVVRRGRSHVAGTISSLLSHGDGYAYIPLLGTSCPMRVKPKEGHVLRVGDRVTIHVTKWDKNESQGEVSVYIGHITDPSVDVKALVEEFGLSSDFPAAVLEEARSFGDKVTAKDKQNREDLQHIECFTIDPQTAKDFDDALSLSLDEEGNYLLGVHIADVSHYVRPGTALDAEAAARCNSVYFPGIVIPMLPHELSSHLCSLMPKVIRLTASVLMKFDKEGTLLEYRIARSFIKSCKRFSYEEAKEVLDDKRKSEHRNTLFLMCDLCHRLKQKRFGRGSLELSTTSTQVIVDEKGVPLRFETAEYDITHQLVEEFMLKANEVIATHLAKLNKPLTYRIHEEPDSENMKEFGLVARALGFTLPKEPTAQDLQELFDKARATALGPFLTTCFIRSMKLASYSVQNIGHYGLGLDYYTHFTSPIRRYIDLIVHRVLFEETNGDEHLNTLAEACSTKERLAAKAEMSALLIKKLRLLERHHEEHPQESYEAIITSIKPFGIAFEITAFFLEGFLPLSALHNDFFVFDEKGRSLHGKYNGKSYKTGDHLKVNLSEINLITQETRWMLANGSKKPPKKKHRRR